MHFQWVKQLVRRRSGSAAAAPAQAPTVPAPAFSPGQLRYPPVDRGLQVMQPDAILASNSELMHRLNLHAAQEQAQFELRFVGPLQRLAAFVNVLPGTATGVFSGETGLFRAALEMAFYSFQSSDGRIFTGREGVERRHALEGRWRYLCFLAGLLYPLGRTLERVVVASPDGKVWKRHFGGISAWAESNHSDRLFVSWASTSDDEDVMEASGSVAALIPLIAGPENLQMLEDGMADLVSALYELAAGGQPSGAGVAHQVLANCWDRVCRREEARRPQAFGRVTAGTHQGPYLIGAIRALVEQGAWKVNASCLRADRDGLYLHWPEAAKDLIAYGRQKAIAGWPDNAPTLAELLKASGIVIDGRAAFGFVELVDDSGEIRHGLQFENPLAVLEDFNPDDYADRAPRKLESVLEADPIAKSEPSTPPPAAKAPAGVNARKRGPRSKSSAPDAIEAAGDGDEVEHPDDSDHSRVEPIEHTARETPSRPQEAESGRLKEAPDVKFADLVPEEVRNQLGNALQAELLGKIIKAWRDRGPHSTTMRRTDEGAALAMDFLREHMRDAVSWVDSMARAGMVYSPPDKRGLRMLKVSIPEGRPPVNAVILNNNACKRLGL
jgi:conjugal transfer pilus assembly protein TraI